MKRSGFTRAEIAVLVNHATDRTATEKYGKGRGGIKRAKKMLVFQEARLVLVRDKARTFNRGPGPFRTAKFQVGFVASLGIRHLLVRDVHRFRPESSYFQTNSA
jgi:hypothetical protein